MERFQIPHLNGRELSFSDLLDPAAKDRVSHRMHTGITMPLSFVNAASSGVPAQNPALIDTTAIVAIKTHAAAAPAPAHTTNNRGGIPTSPVTFSVFRAPAPPAMYQGGGGNGQLTPRKRPRKNGAPQRADFGNDDTCGASIGTGTASGGTSMDVNDSSHGETSGSAPSNAKSYVTLHNNATNNNGFGSMNWEREDGGGHTSPLKKNQHATSTRVSTRRTNNDLNNTFAAAGSDLSGACVPAVAAGNVGKGVHKRDHQ
jgi:hypothetical protein